jgi:chitin synthase
VQSTTSLTNTKILQYILESFGSARTNQNENASRFGKYTELQFNARGRLAGSKTLAYYLEKVRVSSPPTGERNFHVFYYLIAGASPEERHHLLLDDHAQYRYLGNRSLFGRRDGSDSTEEDELRFHQLQAAFKSVGLSKRNVAQICQLVAAILHLGNIEFVSDKGRNEDAAVVKNVEVLQTVADFLGVRPEALENVFSYRSKMLKKELVTAFLDTEGAATNRDELANTLYSLLFTWITEHLNQKLCKDDFASFIGLLDFPGFQNLAGATSRNNSLDQFCVNYANEKMQNWIQQRVFNGMTADFAQEGLTGLSPPVAFFDNSECLRLIDNQPGGLIHITDDQARRVPKKTEHTMIEAYAKRWGNHGSFKLSGMDRTGFPTFTVSHFTGPVTYSTEAFLEKDADVINPDFVSLLRGNSVEEKQRNRRTMGVPVPTSTESTGSSNPFVQGLFTSKAVATEVHPHDEDTIVAAQQSVKPMRAPSMRRKGRLARLAAVGEEGEDAEEAEEGAEVGGGNNEAPVRGIRCILGEFKSSMDVLYQALDDTQPWYVFCLNPNDAHLPNQVETRGLRGQIRAFGMAELVKKLKHVYEVQMTHEEGCERYANELNGYGILHGGSTPAVESMKKLFAAKGMTEDDFAVGKTKVFLSQRGFHRFENRLRLDDEDQHDGEKPATLDFLSAGQHRPENQMYGMRGGAQSSGLLDKFDNPYHENASHAALPLVPKQGGYADAAPSEIDDVYDDHKTMDDGYTRYGDNASYVGTEAYAPSKNMFSSADVKDKNLDEKELLNAPHDGETAEELKETPSRRRWRLLCSLLTFWIPGFLLSWLGGMKRPDIRQAWREKLAINLIIWFICGCAIFVIAVLGNLICPRQYVYNAGELAEHNYQDSPDSVYVSIRGEVSQHRGFHGLYADLYNIQGI